MSKSELIASVRAVIKNSPPAQIRGTKLADKLEEIIEACYNEGGGGGISGAVIVTESRVLTEEDINKLLVIQPAEGETEVNLTAPSVAPFLPLGEIVVFNTASEIPVTVPDTGDQVFIAYNEVATLVNATSVGDGIKLKGGYTSMDGNKVSFPSYALILGYAIQYNSVKPGKVSLTAGTVTVSDENVKADSIIMVTVVTPSGTQGFLSVPTASIIEYTSFVINSSSATDASEVAYTIFNK